MKLTVEELEFLRLVTENLDPKQNISTYPVQKGVSSFREIMAKRAFTYKYYGRVKV